MGQTSDADPLVRPVLRRRKAASLFRRRPDEPPREVSRDEPQERPRRKAASPLRRGRMAALPWMRMGVVSAAMVAGLVALAPHRQPPAPPEELAPVPLAALITPPPVWQPVAQPMPLYGLEGVERSALSLEVRRHASGGREDALGLAPVSFGAWSEPVQGRLRVSRGFTDPEPASFYVSLVRQAAQAGLSVVRSAQSVPFATKFGPGEVASVTLSGAFLAGAPREGTPAERGCLALRLAHPEVQFSLHALLCGAGTQAPPDAQLACLLDRLVLTGSEDPALRVLFAQADRQRSGACPPPPPAVAARGDRTVAEADPLPVERAAQPPRPQRTARSSRL